MSPSTAYVILAFPFVVYVLNPVEFWWGFRQGQERVPSSIAGKAKRASSIVLHLRNALLMALVLIQVLRHSVSAGQVGLSLRNWGTGLLAGAVGGTCWVAIQGLVWRALRQPRPNSLTDCFGTGSISSWVGVFAFGAFAEEIWVAFSIFALRATGHSVLVSVVLTAIAFGAAHASLRFGALAKVVFGVGVGLLFVWLNSLLATYSVHLLTDLGGLYWVRRSRHDTGSEAN